MKKIFSLNFLIISFLYSFSQTTCQIRGTVDPKNKIKEVILLSSTDNIIFNSKKTNVINGIFEFNNIEPTVYPAYIKIVSLPEDTITTTLFLEKGSINIDYLEETEFNKELKGYRTGGTRLNDLLQFYDDQSMMYSRIITNEYKIYLEESTKIDRMTRISDIISHYREIFIKDNLNNPVGNYILFKDIDFLDTDFINEVYAMGDTSQRKQIDSFLASKHEKEKKEEEAKKEREEISQNNIYYTGRTIKNFDLLTVEGDSVKLHDYIGEAEYTYIDIWASWCGPCIADIPNLKKIYDTYNRSQLTIISIAIEDTKGDWKNALKKAGMPWTNLLEETSMELNKKLCKIRDSYNIVSIPAGFLVNRKGEIIISGGIRSHQLEWKIKELITH